MCLNSAHSGARKRRFAFQTSISERGAADISNFGMMIGSQLHFLSHEADQYQCRVSTCDVDKDAIAGEMR